MTAPSAGPGRHEARERALQLLYESDARSMPTSELLDALPIDPDPYAVAIVSGVEADGSRVDAAIDACSEGWSLHRMPAVDRAILRLAAWELIARADVPAAVVIDEAVELAKDYSTERSPGFINGVLDSVANAVRD